MHRSAAAFLGLALAAGCGGGFEFRDALVIYRSPLEAETPGKAPAAGGGQALYFGFVNAANSRWAKDGAPSPDLPGTKPVDEQTAEACLERMADEGFPSAWDAAPDVQAALASRPRQHVLVAEVDGAARVLARPGPSADPVAVEGIRRFVACKEALMQTAGYGSGFRVVSNKAGSALFESEQQRLRREAAEGKK
jgi:hypothetical protein